MTNEELIREITKAIGAPMIASMHLEVESVKAVNTIHRLLTEYYGKKKAKERQSMSNKAMNCTATGESKENKATNCTTTSAGGCDGKGIEGWALKWTNQ